MCFQFRFKIFKLGEDLTSKGKEFHKKGAATVKV